MSEELQQKLRDQLWEVANKCAEICRPADFMYFTLGFIFYKYLSEKIEAYANNALWMMKCPSKNVDYGGRGCRRTARGTEKAMLGGCRLLHRTDLPFLIGDRPDKEEREHIAHS